MSHVNSIRQRHAVTIRHARQRHVAMRLRLVTPPAATKTPVFNAREGNSSIPAFSLFKNNE